MPRNHDWFGAARIALGLLAGAATAHAADAPALKSTATGTPKVQAIEVIRFAPEGVLLIGDGKGAQVLAVNSGDTAPKAAWKDPIEKIDEKIAGKLGTTAKGIDILGLAVNPASGIAYLAVRKQDDKKHLIVTVDGTGKIGEFALEDVKYARVALPAGDKGGLTKVTDLAWAGDRIFVAGQANEEFAAKMYVIPAPVEHDGKANIYSADTFHVSHGKWETRAPMTALMAFEDQGKKYLVGSFFCTPVVKYALEDIKPGAAVKGVSVVELGYGNTPRHMFPYEKDGKSYVLLNSFRVYHKQAPVGPSPYWSVRLDADLLKENEKVNAKAIVRTDNKLKPITDKIKLVEDYHGGVHVARLDKERALVVREDGKGGFTLAVLLLP